MKTCSKCGLSKEEREFHKHKSTTDGLQYHCKECRKEELRVWWATNPQRNMFTGAKKRAKRDGIPFSIELDDIVIPPICPVLKIPLFSGGFNNPNAPSLDRVNNSKGYIKGNVAVISFRANSRKSSMTIEQVEQLLKYMKGELDV